MRNNIPNFIVFSQWGRKADLFDYSVYLYEYKTAIDVYFIYTVQKSNDSLVCTHIFHNTVCVYAMFIQHIFVGSIKLNNKINSHDCIFSKF